MSKSHPQQWAVVEDDLRPDRALVEALAQFPTTQIADCGGPIAMMGPDVRWMAGGQEICGPAVTVWTKPGDILFVLKAPDLLQVGDVLVIDGGGRRDAALIGDIAGGVAKGRGAAGMIVDGAVRDLDGIDEIGFPTYAVAAHPATGSITGPGAIGVTVQCGGVVVRPGDVIRADRSGVVVVAREHLAEVVERTREVDAKEESWRGQWASGRGLADVLGLDALIEAGRGTTTVGEA